MHKTKIDWCDYTWNPVWGCLNSCPYCYARSTANRWGISFEPHWRERNFNRVMPRQPARIFVNSMSDVMYWKPEWWERVLQRVRENPRHTFLFLTQDPHVYATQFYDPGRYWMSQVYFSKNCWLGATATTSWDVKAAQEKLKHVRPTFTTFLSIEPILEGIDPAMIDPEAVSWVILAAETGNRPGRVVPPADWIEPWLQAKMPVFMKHNLPWSGPWRKEYPA